MLAMTTLFLVAVFVGAEFYRFRQRITGLVREIRPVDGDATGLMGARLQVLTAQEGEVSAFVSGCQMCVSPVEVGESVSLIPGPDGYIIKPSWIPGRRAEACCRRAAS